LEGIKIRINDWPDIVRAVGIEVDIDAKFATRSQGELPEKSADGKGNVRIVWHHDATQSHEWLTSSWDKNEPSAQIWVDTNGKWWFIGSGMAYHAGAVEPGMPDNKNSVGIETDHTTGESWPQVQVDSLRKGTAALLNAQGRGSDFLFFHKQIAPKRKQDPDGLEIAAERKTVGDLIKNGIAGAVLPVVGGSQGTAGSASDLDPFKMGVFNYLFIGKKFDASSYLFTKELAAVNDQQLMSTIQAIVSASLRSFMSGPDGSFVAFFPDYFGLYHEKGQPNYSLQLEDIELVDFKIDVNDDNLATDVFVAGSTSDTENVAPMLNSWLNSNGVVNIRQNDAMALMLGDQFVAKDNFDPDAFYNRFGLRPLKAEFPQINDHIYEYVQALTLFMRTWAAQYSTQVQFTFMPELMPGMRILIKSHKVTVFVEEVVHTGSFDTGFSTTATISSPASVDGGGIAGMVVGQI